MLTRWNDFGFDDLDRSFAALNDLRQELKSGVLHVHLKKAEAAKPRTIPIKAS